MSERVDNLSLDEHGTQVVSAEIGYTIPELLPVSGNSEPANRWRRIKESGAYLLQVINDADDADKARGISGQF